MVHRVVRTTDDNELANHRLRKEKKLVECSSCRSVRQMIRRMVYQKGIGASNNTEIFVLYIMNATVNVKSELIVSGRL